MRILGKGRLSEHVVMLGDVFFPAYLIEGETVALVDSGVVMSGPHIVEALRAHLGSGARLDLNLITHSHFDHMGSTPFLRRVFPGMKVVGSPVVDEVLSNPRAVALIRTLGGDAGDARDEATGLPLSFETFALDRPVRDGDVLDLGAGVRATVVETPGHTRCSVAYYVEPDGAIFMGEASGVPLAGGYIQSEFLSDYDAYMDSLAKMAACRPRVVCLPHGGALAAGEAEEYFERAAEAARAFRRKIESLLDREGGSEEAAVTAIRAEEFDTGGIAQDETAYMVNLRAMVRTIARAIAGTPGG